MRTRVAASLAYVVRKTGASVGRVGPCDVADRGRLPRGVRAGYLSHSSVNLRVPPDRSTEWDVLVPWDRHARPPGSGRGSGRVRGRDHEKRHAGPRGSLPGSGRIHDRDHQERHARPRGSGHGSGWVHDRDHQERHVRPGGSGHGSGRIRDPDHHERHARPRGSGRGSGRVRDRDHEKRHASPRGSGADLAWSVASRRGVAISIATRWPGPSARQPSRSASAR